MGLTNEQLQRYHRQLLLPEMDEQKQLKLLSAKILIVGAGGLGSPATSYLVGAGIGTVGIVDSEKVELSNLHRQVLYVTDDLGKEKTIQAQKRLNKSNPDIKIKTYNLRVNSENVRDLVANYDLVLDCSDNFETRFLINDTCVRVNKNLVHGAIFRAEGQIMAVLPGKGPCLRCVFPSPPKIPQKTEGVFGPSAGVIGNLMATEAIKIILDLGNILAGEMLVYNAWEMNFRKVIISRRFDCQICGN